MAIYSIFAQQKLFDFPNVFRLFYSYEIFFLIIDPETSLQFSYDW